MEKILIITSCSAKKRNYKTKASDLYQGQLFKKVKKFVRLNKFDFKIISAKYGLLNPNDIVKPYDKTISSRNDIIYLRKIVIPKLLEIIDKYNIVLIIMSSNYRKVLEPLDKRNLYYIVNNKGIGGYSSLMSVLLKINRNDIIESIKKRKSNIITIKDFKTEKEYGTIYF